MKFVLLGSVFALQLAAQHDVRRLVARLGEEAEAFRAVAPQVLGEETLKQRSQKPAPRVKFRVGDAAKKPPQGTWVQHSVVSEYAFGTFGGTFHELRQIVNIDGKKTAEKKQAQDALARVIVANNVERKKELLRQFEDTGLLGAATDFGQLLLLFDPTDILHYEFSPKGIAALGDVGVFIFHFRQLDGTEALTVLEKNAKRENDRQLRVEGDVWVSAETYTPLKITLRSTAGEGDKTIAEEAEVAYRTTAYGCVLPSSVSHRELRAGHLVAENNFTYAEFHKFAASSDIKFEVLDDKP